VPQKKKVTACPLILFRGAPKAKIRRATSPLRKETRAIARLTERTVHPKPQMPQAAKWVVTPRPTPTMGPLANRPTRSRRKKRKRKAPLVPRTMAEAEPTRQHPKILLPQKLRSVGQPPGQASLSRIRQPLSQ